MTMNGLPNGWELQPLSNIAKIYNGNSINKQIKQERYTGLSEGRNFIATKDVMIDGSVVYENGVKIPQTETTFKTAPAGSVFVCSEGGSAGRKTAYITQEVCFGNKLYAIVDEKNYFVGKYIYYFTRYNQFYEQFKELMNGIIGGVSVKNFGTITIPIPSISEQQRIVAKIEELFSNLEASVAELKTAKEKLKVYRQAVLKEAFEGIKNYSITTISEVCSEIKVGIVIKPTQYYVDTNGICAFRNANVRRNHIQDENWVMISEEGHIKNQKSIVHANDVLIARSGVNLGMAAVVSTKYDGFNAIDIVIAVPIDKMVKSDYLSYYTNSPLGIEKIKAKQRGVAQGHLNVNEYSQISLILPSLKEQEKIVQEIESRLSVCDNIETTIDTALQQAEVLRQSILKQAFEGKLI